MLIFPNRKHDTATRLLAKLVAADFVTGGGIYRSLSAYIFVRFKVLYSESLHDSGIPDDAAPPK